MRTHMVNLGRLEVGETYLAPSKKTMYWGSALPSRVVRQVVADIPDGINRVKIIQANYEWDAIRAARNFYLPCVLVDPSYGFQWTLDKRQTPLFVLAKYWRFAIRRVGIGDLI